MYVFYHVRDLLFLVGSLVHTFMCGMNFTLRSLTRSSRPKASHASIDPKKIMRDFCACHSPSNCYQVSSVSLMDQTRGGEKARHGNNNVPLYAVFLQQYLFGSTVCWHLLSFGNFYSSRHSRHTSVLHDCTTCCASECLVLRG